MSFQLRQDFNDQLSNKDKWGQIEIEMNKTI